MDRWRQGTVALYQSQHVKLIFLSVMAGLMCPVDETCQAACTYAQTICAWVPALSALLRELWLNMLVTTHACISLVGRHRRGLWAMVVMLAMRTAAKQAVHTTAQTEHPWSNMQGSKQAVAQGMTPCELMCMITFRKMLK